MADVLPHRSLIKDWSKYNILIVDDDPLVLDQIKDDLFFEKFSLLTAQGPEEAWDILDDEDIAVILCDQKMPELQGTQFLTQVRKQYPYIVGMILSAFSEREYLLDALNEAKALCYLLKPWKKEELIQHLYDALEFYHFNYFEKLKLVQDELSFTREVLKDAVYQLGESKLKLHEAKQAFQAISNVSNQISTTMQAGKKKIRLVQ